MINLTQITDQAGEWLRGTGPHSDIVISSRIRLARNLAGFPFVGRAGRSQRQETLQRCSDEIMKSQFCEKLLWIDLLEATDLDRQILVERHLISRQHAQTGPEVPRGVAIDQNETFAIMVNEEDHLRIQVLRSGMQLSSAAEQIQAMDSKLEESLDFSYSTRWGYLTACPTNLGTGIRVSVMLHLPALKLIGEIDKVRRAARDMHLAVRGLFGEGSEALGDLYQISNQTTLGKSDEEILADFEHTIVPQMIRYEQRAREALLKQRRVQLDDKIWRAWGILTNAHFMGAEEVLQLLSHLRLGINLGRINKVNIAAINELFLLTQPGHLQAICSREMNSPRRREARAELVRSKLNAFRSPDDSESGDRAI